MRLLVCGGRDFNDQRAVFAILDRVRRRLAARGEPLAVLIHGDAPGADRLANRWAEINAIRREPYPADWKGQGNAAGVLRNQRMLDQGLPDRVIAFPGGDGTADMVRRALAAGVPVWEPFGDDDKP